jgi:hypothetical protein
MADIKDVLKDILKHTHGLDIFEMVKIVGTEKTTTIETVDKDKTVVVKAELAKPCKEFKDETVGLSRMGVLSGFLNFNGFTKIKPVTQQRNGVDLLSELDFESKVGTNARYRFMMAEIINNQLKDIKFKGATFDVDVVPDARNLEELSYFAGTLSNFESFFTPKTENGDLYFLIGDENSDRTKLLINAGVKGKITHEHKWPLKIVLSIMKLGASGKISMSINNKGLLKIEVDSGLGVYTYLLPSQG